MPKTEYKEIWIVKSTTSDQYLKGWNDLAHTIWCTAWQDAMWFADDRSADMAGRVSGASRQFWTKQQKWVNERDHQYRSAGC